MTHGYVAHRSPKQMIKLVGLLAVLGALLVLVDPTALVPGDPVTLRGQRSYRLLELLAVVVPWIGALAIVVALACVPRIMNRGVVIVVGPDGITYPPALKQQLPWDRIEKINVRKLNIYRVLAVHIRDADSFPIKGFARRVAQLNRLSGDFGHINIEVQRSDGKFDELLAAVERYMPVTGTRDG